MNNSPMTNASAEEICLVEVTESAGCHLQLGVEIAPSLSAKVHSSAAKELAKEIQLPGFRPGKAPLHYLKIHRADQVSRKWGQMLAETALQRALKICARTPFAGKSIQYSWQCLSLDQSSLLQAHFEAAPLPPDEIDPISLRVDLPQEVIAPTRGEIDRALAEKADRLGLFQTVDRPIALGDWIDVEIDSAGSPTESLYRNWALNLRADLTPQWVSPLVLGMCGGESRSACAPLELGADSSDCRVKVHRNYGQEEPFGDALAKRAGFESLAALRESVAQKLAQQRAGELRALARSALLKAIVQTLDFEVPKSAFESELASFRDQTEGDPESDRMHRERALTQLRQFFLISHWGRAHASLVDSREIDQLVRANLPPLRADISREEAHRQVGALYQNAKLTLISTRVLDGYLVRLGWSPQTALAISPPRPG